MSKVKNSNKEVEKLQVKWASIRNLLHTNGAFLVITDNTQNERWIRRDAITTFKVSDKTVWYRVLGDTYDQSISFPSRWEALKLAEEISKGLAV